MEAIKGFSGIAIVDVVFLDLSAELANSVLARIVPVITLLARLTVWDLLRELLSHLLAMSFREWW